MYSKKQNLAKPTKIAIENKAMSNIFSLTVLSRIMQKRPGDRLKRTWLECIVDKLLSKGEGGEIRAIELLMKTLETPKEINQAQIVSFIMSSNTKDIQHMLGLSAKELTELEGKLESVKNNLAIIDIQDEKAN